MTENHLSKTNFFNHPVSAYPNRIFFVGLTIVVNEDGSVNQILFCPPLVDSFSVFSDSLQLLFSRGWSV